MRQNSASSLTLPGDHLVSENFTRDSLCAPTQQLSRENFSAVVVLRRCKRLQVRPEADRSRAPRGRCVLQIRVPRPVHQSAERSRRATTAARAFDFCRTTIAMHARARVIRAVFSGMRHTIACRHEKPLIRGPRRFRFYLLLRFGTASFAEAARTQTGQCAVGQTGNFSRRTSVVAPKQGWVAVGGTGVVPWLAAGTVRRREYGTGLHDRLLTPRGRDWKRFRGWASVPAESRFRSGCACRVDRRTPRTRDLMAVATSFPAGNGRGRCSHLSLHGAAICRVAGTRSGAGNETFGQPGPSRAEDMR